MLGRLVWLGLRLLIYGWILSALLHDGRSRLAPPGLQRRRSRRRSWWAWVFIPPAGNGPPALAG